jgi:hypothetical protein
MNRQQPTTTCLGVVSSNVRLFKDETARASKLWEILQDSGIGASATTIEWAKFITDDDI